MEASSIPWSNQDANEGSGGEYWVRYMSLVAIPGSVYSFYVTAIAISHCVRNHVGEVDLRGYLLAHSESIIHRQLQLQTLQIQPLCESLIVLFL